MKKFILAVLTTLVLIPAQAQLVHSTTITKIKEPRKILWYVRAGVSMNNATGSYVSKMKEIWKDNDSKEHFGVNAGYDFEFGFQKPIGNAGVYYSLALALGTDGFTTRDKDEYFSTNGDKKYTWDDRYSLSMYNIRLLPVTFGYKYAVTNDIKVDAHLGLFAGGCFTGKSTRKWDDNEYVNGELIHFDKDSKEDDWVEFKDVNKLREFDMGLQLGVGVWFKKLNLDFTWQRGFVNRLGTLEDLNPERAVYTSNFMIRLGIGF